MNIPSSSSCTTDCSTLEAYQYQRLEPGSIRLFQILAESTPEDIRCRMYHQPGYMDSAVKYIALSYTWGNPRPVAPINICGFSLPVAENLLHWLRAQHERMLDPSIGRKRRIARNCLYWVDAICINQGDITERSAQVPLMRYIYSNAKYVMVWLGKSEQGIVHAIETSIALKKMYYGKPWGQDLEAEAQKRSVRDAILALCEVNYFTRLWVVPEMICAKVLIFKCGVFACGWSGMAILDTLHKMSEICKCKGGISTQVTDAKGQIQLDEKPLQVLMSALRSNLHLKCADVRDKIFILAMDPRFTKWSFDVYIRPDYAMSEYEVCAMALSYVDWLIAEEQNQSGFRPWFGSRDDDHGLLRYSTFVAEAKRAIEDRIRAQRDAIMPSSSRDKHELETDSLRYNGFSDEDDTIARLAQSVRAVVQDVFSLFNIKDAVAQDFRKWLRSSISNETVQTRSGTNVDCSGPVLKDLNNEAVLGSGTWIWINTYLPKEDRGPWTEGEWSTFEKAQWDWAVEHLLGVKMNTRILSGRMHENIRLDFGLLEERTSLTTKS